MIRKATLLDIESILLITQACANYMIQKNIYQWNADYPNEEVFKADVLRDELFVIEKNATIMGCIAISSKMDEEYKAVDWLTPTTAHFYIHRLAIRPKLQGQGLAQKLMDYAEHLCRKNQLSSIRLDTFSQNTRNQRFYEQRGYVRLGNIYFPKQSEHPFYCYELIL